MFAAHAAPDDFVELDVVGFVGSAKIHLLRSARAPREFTVYRLEIDQSKDPLVSALNRLLPSLSSLLENLGT
jgi:hypothetical protein